MKQYLTSLSYALHIGMQQLLSWVSTFCMQWRLFRWGAEGGHRARFFGLTSVLRHPDATLILGPDTVFRSHPSSSRIGLQQRCMLSVFRGARLEIGSQCGFSGTVISCHQHISLGDRVLCGANVTITDADQHSLDPRRRAAGEAGEAAPVSIGNDVWLGMNTLILKGAKIGDNVVIAANSVVTGDIPANTIAAGVPARPLKKGS
ncbi:acyltransferase [Lacimicrobium alkaliphilum]|uniref:Acyltransferase n=1 Tax=Lacimicrobium alkaliphilum TaxID=1526571 RepID=A0ABQ1RPH3_9ALTE|nr:acyltransferase [Lacimicrobium alkaliphilum]GGD73890.1 hypothetical protein GCM10011357_31160 [Lacimicrobium alkaliphilum]